MKCLRSSLVSYCRHPSKRSCSAVLSFENKGCVVYNCASQKSSFNSDVPVKPTYNRCINSMPYNYHCLDTKAKNDTSFSYIYKYTCTKKWNEPH